MTAIYNFMSNIDFLRNEIFSRYGIVKRARGCFLYTAKGVRLTDLYQEGGRAILGWGGGSSFTMLKNTLNRGITGSFETGFAYRTQKAVQALFNSERKVFYFDSYEKALKAALLISKEGTSVYRPWQPAGLTWSECSCIIFAPPLPWAQNLFIVAAKPELVSEFSSADSDDSDSLLEELLPQQTFIPAPLNSALARSIYDLIEALQTREEKNWFVYDPVVTKYWERKGPYLFPKIPQEKYTAFVKHCLDCGIVVSPFYNEPSIVPFGAEFGNFSKLKKNPFEF